MSRCGSRATLIAALAVWVVVPPGSAVGQGQQRTEQPVFRTGVQIVEVDVRVFDRDGRFVSNLTRDDFEVIESGSPQKILTLYLVDGRPAGSDRSGPAPATPVAPVASPATARQTWIFVFDLNHLAPGGAFDRAKKAVEAYVLDRFREGDLGGIVAGTRMVNNRLTSIREELVEAARSVKPNADSRTRHLALTREWPRLQDEYEALQIANNDREAIQRAVIRACNDDPDACRVTQPDLQVREKAQRLRVDIHRATQETLAAVNALASGLSRVPGPKTVVFLSDGFVVQDVETSLRSVVGQMARAGARVYAIDMRGLNRGNQSALIDQAAVGDSAGGPAGMDALEDGPNSLAVDTGGMMIRNENNIGRALETIAADSNHYYVIGYQPLDAVFDGRFRPIEVRVRQGNVRVRARRGYLALEPSRLLVPRPVNPPPEPELRPAAAEQPAAGGAAPATAEPAGVPNEGTRTAASPDGAPDPSASAPRTAAAIAQSAAGSPFRFRPDVARRVDEIAGSERAAGGAIATQGWDAYQRGDVETAVVAFAKAAEEPDVRPWVLYALGLSQAALDRPREAIESWERVRRAAPDFQPVYNDLAATYSHLSELTSALTVLRDAQRRWPADPEVNNAIGVIHVRRGALDEAIAAFVKAVETGPQEALTYYNLGRAYELRYERSRRYVKSQRRWVADEDDRRKAVEHYSRHVEMKGTHQQAASEALQRLAWSK